MNVQMSKSKKHGKTFEKNQRERNPQKGNLRLSKKVKKMTKNWSMDNNFN